VFNPLVVTRETVQANVTERCQRLGVDKVDLLQFHWQFVRMITSIFKLHMFIAVD
jgi:aryl-alcohol dehydrogenase-like predicted oxidoreductase